MKAPLFLIFLALISSACAPVMQTYYVYDAPTEQSGKQCLNHCLDIKATCENNSEALYNQCRSVAVSEYNTYIYARQSQGLPVEKTLSNFDYCQKRENCQPSYNKCYTNCGGSVREEERCVAFCK
jgi:hypothetical protein